VNVRWQRWHVIVACLATVAVLTGVIVAVFWWLDPGCVGAFGGRTANKVAFSGKASTDKAEVTAANLAFGGDANLGKAIWNSRADGDVSVLGNTVLQDDDKFYGGQYAVLDAANGQPKWSRPRPDGRKTIPGGLLGLDVNKDDKGHVARFDADTGSLKWCQTLPYAADHSAKGTFTVASDDPASLVVLTSDPDRDASAQSTLAVLDAESGKARWTVDLPARTEKASAGSGLVVTIDGHTDSSGNTYFLTAYDVRTGAQLWRHKIPVRLTGDASINPNLTATVWGVRGGQIVTAQTGSSIKWTPAAVAFDRTGAEKWAKPISIGSLSDDRAVLADNLLVTTISGKDSPLAGLRLSDGSTAWTGPGGLSTAVGNSVIHQGKLYVPGPRLYVFGLSTGQSQTSPVRCDGVAIVNDTLVCQNSSYYEDLGGSTVAYPIKR
jgi:outer membrane protein assembly factor BamB